MVLGMARQRKVDDVKASGYGRYELSNGTDFR